MFQTILRTWNTIPIRPNLKIKSGPFLQIEEVATIFAAEEIIRKGELAEYMFQNSAFRQDALNMESIKDKTEDWKKTRNEKYIREAGWHFKTLAVQEVGAYKVSDGFG